MATENKTLTPTPIQIADGTQSRTIQVFYDAIFLADSETSPAPGAPAHEVTVEDRWIRIEPPMKAWVWSKNSYALIVVT